MLPPCEVKMSFRPLFLSSFRKIPVYHFGRSKPLPYRITVTSSDGRKTKVRAEAAKTRPETPKS